MSLNNNERTAADCLLMLGSTSQGKDNKDSSKSSPSASPPITPARQSPSKVPVVPPPAPAERPTTSTAHHVSFAPSSSPPRYAGALHPSERSRGGFGPSSSPSMLMHSHRRQRVPALHHPGVYSVRSGPPPPPPPPMGRHHPGVPSMASSRSPAVRLAMRPGGLPPPPPSSARYPYHTHHPHHHHPVHHPHHPPSVHHQAGVSPSHRQQTAASGLEQKAVVHGRPVSPNSVHSDLGGERNKHQQQQQASVSPDSSPRGNVVLKTAIPGGNALPEPHLKQEPAADGSSSSEQQHAGTNANGEITPCPLDVLIGTGRTCSSHPGNRRFHKEIYDTCEDYFEADYKKGVVDRAIRAVHRRGGRFLTKKGDEWVLVTDHDRLERNTRKSFHMARKQRATQAERRGEEAKMAQQHRQQSPSSAAMRSPTSVTTVGHHPKVVGHHHSPMHHQQHPTSFEQRMLKPGMPLPQGGPNKGLHVAVYSRAVGAYCVGTIEARAKNLYLLRYEDSRLGTEWVDLDKADCRVFSN